MNKFSILVGILILCGCNNRTHVRDIITNSTQIRVDIPELSDPSSFMGFDVKGDGYFSILKGDNEICLQQTKNGKWNCFELTKLDTSSDLLSYTLDKHGYIYRISSNQLIISDFKGRLVDNWLFSKSQFKNSDVRIIDGFYKYFPLEVIEDGLIYRQHRVDVNFWHTEYFKTSCGVLIDFHNHQITDFGPSFPKHQQEISYGNLYDYYHTVVDDIVIYSFQTDYRLHKYDHGSDKVELFESQSQYHQKAIIPFDTAYKEDMNRVFDHIKVNPVYLKILYDPYRNLIYRYYWDDVNLENENGEYSRVFDKKLYLMVLDKDLRVLREIELESDSGWFFSFVMKDGLYVKQFNDETDKVTYEVYNIYN